MSDLIETLTSLASYSDYIIAFIAILIGSFIARIISNMFYQSTELVFSKNRLHASYKTLAPRLSLSLPIQLITVGWTILLATSILDLAPQLITFSFHLAKVLTYIGAVWASLQGATIVESFLIGKANQTSTKFDNLLAPLIGKSIKITIILLGLISIAELLKLPLTSLLTGLGIGGIALAMAAKDTLANIFGSITIIMDRPFNIGDWVKIDNVEGTVENLGFRSTKIRTFYNSLITVPNSNLLTASVDNMGARTYRRFSTTLNIVYDTSPERLEAFCASLRDLIRSHPQTRKDYFLVHVHNLSSSSIDIMLYCFFQVPDWGQELSARETLILDIMRTAEKLGISFAFPTQTVHLQPPESVTLNSPS